jgi:hypothetical protein
VRPGEVVETIDGFRDEIDTPRLLTTGVSSQLEAATDPTPVATSAHDGGQGMAQRGDSAA